MSTTARNSESKRATIAAGGILTDELKQRIANEVNATAAAAKVHEADEERAGTTLKMTGARYRIYDTKAPEGL